MAVTALLTVAATALSLPPGSAAATGTPSAAATPVKQPNILLVTTDDQTASDMRFMPFTRRFFGQGGVTFADAVSPYPLCCPARATLLTGQLSHNHQVLTNWGPHGGYEAFVNSGQQDKTLPTWLQSVGYRTMFTGKYLNGYGRGKYLDDVPPGWTEWNATAGAGIGSYTDFNLSRNGVLTPYRDSYQTTVLGRMTRDFVQRSVQDNEPFFVWESNLAPHGGCRLTSRSTCRWGPPVPARQDRTKFPRLNLHRPGDGSFNERVVGDKPAHVRREPRWSAARIDEMGHWNRQRARSLVAVDRSFEATVEELQQLGELDDTLVIFASDNGYLIGQHRWQGKILPYQPSLRVPMLMRGPGVPAGSRITETVALVDLAPTIAAAAGATPTLISDGQPLQPVLQGIQKGYGTLSIEAGPFEPGDWPTWLYRGVRTSRYTYVVYPGSHDVELYDRHKDPHEMTNVAYRPAYRETRAALAAKLRQLRSCVGPECYQVGGADVPDPEREPHLDSGATLHPDDLGSIGRARQVVTITAPNWRTGRGHLTAWVRNRRTWTVARGPFRVQLGANGLIPERVRRQGTGETPAGTFTAHSALGLRPPVRTSLRYRRLDQNDHWVFDPRVPETYNVNQPRRSRHASWRSAYALRWAEERARFSRAMLIDYNLPSGIRPSERFGELRSGTPADVRKGSFVMHTNRRLEQHGWVAMDGRKLTWLLRWADAGRRGTKFVVGTTNYLYGNL